MEQAPLKNEAAPNIQAALSQAEQEHWLERANAPLALRLASLILDLIFIYLFSHSLHRIIEALSLYSATNIENQSFLMNPFFLGFVDVFFRTGFIFFYLIVAVSTWGGTLGNLLLGLRVIDAQSGKKLNLTRTTNRLLFALATNVLSLAVAMSRPDCKWLHDLLSKTVTKKVRGRT